MKNSIAVFLASMLLALLAAGCATRSISDSGYRRPGQPGSAFYQGELNEFEVIGLKPDAAASEAEIKRALESRSRLVLRKGTRILLIQSGAMIPDEAMSAALGKYYEVSVFSGVPAKSGGANASALRLAAAKAGCQTIMVYWGLLETAQNKQGGKIISWLPIFGGVVPDESQEMRIRLKTALIDVRSGQWESYAPEPFQVRAWSARFTREASDQAQVAFLKAKAYEALVGDIVKIYAAGGRSD